MSTVARSLVMLLGTALLTAGPAMAGEWPGFRGATGLGYSQEKNLPITWGGKDRQNVRWTSPLKGEGHASPIVWGDSVIVCTVKWPPGPAAREKVMPEHHVTCYAAADGAVRWNTLVPPGSWLRSDFRSGPGGGYAAPTPVTDGKLIYCVFGSAVMAALDFEGKIVWRKNLVPATFDVTVGSSPVLFNDTVILLCAMAKPADSCVVAFDKATGQEKWRQKFPTMGFGHSTPVIIDVAGKAQMLVLASGASVADDALRSLDPADGKVLWTCRASGDAASPAYGAGIIYCDSGRGGTGFAIDPTGSGDVSKTHVKWTASVVPEGIGSPIIVGPHIYRLHRPGILKCWEAASGTLVYSQRLEGLSTDWASPIADGNGRIYFANGGKSHVIQAGPEFKALAVNDMGDGNHPSPAVAGGKLYIAGLKNLYCIGSKP